MNRLIFLLAITAALVAGCGLQISSVGGATATAFIITSTLPPTAIPSATLTPIPPTLTPTPAPVDGMTATQVNVRSEPSTAGAQLGVLAPFIRVQIVGRDSPGDWYEIVYPQGPGGNGWVTAEYINVQNKDKIPVVGAAVSSPTVEGATGTPSASGTVIQQVNVRKGPGTEFAALGTLDVKEVAALTGRDASGSWLQIQYAGAPDGLGWVAAAFIQSTQTQGLRVIGGETAAASASTPTGTTAPPSATPAIAVLDQDTAQAPAANVILSPSGTRVLIYSSDVSAPDGDTQDFVGFTPYGHDVLIGLTCTGNGALQTELEANGARIADWAGLKCGNTSMQRVVAGVTYVLKFSIVSSDTSPTYVRYTLRVESTG